MEELTSQIDAYLSDSMTSEEKKAFEAALQHDAKLKKELDLQKKTTALLEAAAFLETKNKIQAMNQRSSGSSMGANLLKIAAVLLILVIPTYFILNNQYNDQHLFADYAEPYPDRITTMGNSDESQVTEAMRAYNKQEYATASKHFKTIRLSEDSTDKYVLYEAVSLTYTDQAKQAVELLETTLKGNPTNTESLEWQLILSLLADNQGDRAKSVLDHFLKTNNGYQLEKAKALKKDLNRIWR